MGVETDGILAFGYDLGSEDEGWKVREVDEYGGLVGTAWHDPDDEDPDFEAKMADVLERADVPGNVTVKTHCSDGSPQFILAAKVITANRGTPVPLDLSALDANAAEQCWGDQLEAAFDALGLTPTQPRPRWLLCSYWEGGH
jgi:hypothetical protein